MSRRRSAHSGRALDILFVLGLTALLVSLGALYLSRGPGIARTLNVWFGADLHRHLAWISTPDTWSGAHRHPLAFLFFKASGFIWPVSLEPIGVGSILSGGARVALLVSAALVATGGLLGLRRGVVPLIALPLGPLLVFGMMPESHILGGSALLLAGVCAYRASQECAALAPSFRSFAAATELFVAIAVGCSLSNLLPGVALLFALPPELRSSALRRAGGLALLTAALLLVAMQIKRAGGGDPLHELRYLDLPNAWAWSVAFRELFLGQFGVPTLRLVEFFGSGPGDPAYRLLPAPSPAPLQALSALCWTIGLATAFPGLSAHGRRLCVAALAALLTVIATHAFYAPVESYLFSSHAWPGLLLPTLLCLRERRARTWLIAALLLAAVQSTQSIGAGLALLRYL